MEGLSNPRTRRLCLCFGIERPARRRSADRVRLPATLAEILDGVCEETDLERAAWNLQPTGEGELAVLPPGVDEGRLIDDLVRALSRRLRVVNGTLAVDDRIRMRLAMHIGIAETTESGFRGPAPRYVGELCRSPRLRALLAERPDADFALALSAPLYQDHVDFAYPDFRVQDFRKLDVDVAGSRSPQRVWVCLCPPEGRTPRADRSGFRTRRP
jgi:hypothetical protein